MMHARALALVLAAGCSGGLEIIVDPPAKMDPSRPITRVRLYVAADTIGPMAITPDQATPPGFSASAYKLDPASGLEGGAPPVRFSLEGGTTSKIAQLVAVGFASDGTAVAAISSDSPDIPASGVVPVRIELDSADVLPTAGPVATEDRVQVWGGTSKNECVYNWSALTDNGYQTFIVPDTDYDCDGFANDDRSKECLPTIFNGSRGPVSLDDTNITCIEPGQFSGYCTLAGPECMDGLGPTTGCRPSPYCVPATACTACATMRGTSDGTVLLDCVEDMSSVPPTPPFQHATLTYAGMATAGGYQPCQSQLTIHVFPTGSQHTCASGEIRVRDTMQSWDNQLQRDGLTFNFDVSSTCDVVVTVSGSVSAFTGAPPPIGAVLAVNLTTSNAENHGLALPFVINFEPPGACAGSVGGVTSPMYTSADLLGDTSTGPSGCLNAALAPGTGVQPLK